MWVSNTPSFADFSSLRNACDGIIGGMTTGRLQPGEAFTKWWREIGTALSKEPAEVLTRSAWDAAVRTAVVLVDREVRRYVKMERYFEGDGFDKWWTDVGSTSEPAEVLARSAWDSAVRTAVVLLDREVWRYVKATSYIEAAAIRDCRESTEHLFTSPGQWSATQHLNEKFSEIWKRLLREHSIEQLQAMKREMSDPDGPKAIALASVLRERGV
jgi:hypothetical protein